MLASTGGRPIATLLRHSDSTLAAETKDRYRNYLTKIGLDIPLLSEKRLCDQIVLIAGDSDFVPAAKHARREGIEFILDPMWNHIAPDLNEHINGVRSTSPRPGAKKKATSASGAKKKAVIKQASAK